jgi:hypothetical protein
MGRTPNGYESKKYGFYFPVELVDKVKARLPEEGIKFNALMRGLLIDWLSGKEDGDRAREVRKEAMGRGGW